MAAPDSFEPYRAPVAEPPIVQRPYEYVSLQRRAARVGQLLVAFAVVAGLNAIVDLLDAVALASMGKRGLDVAAAEAMDVRQSVVLLLYGVAFVVTAIPFGRLLAQANRNTVPLGRPAQRHSPASIVWWFFVPIAGWWKPLQAVTEVWNAAEPQPTRATPQTVRRWWGPWLLGTIAGGVAGRAAEKASTPGELGGAYFLDLVACAAMIGAAIAARRMLVQLAELQDRAWLARSG